MARLVIGLFVAFGLLLEPTSSMKLEGFKTDQSDDTYAIEGSIMSAKENKQEQDRKGRLFWGVSELVSICHISSAKCEWLWLWSCSQTTTGGECSLKPDVDSVYRVYMLIILTPIYVICTLFFVFGSWDHEFIRRHVEFRVIQIQNYVGLTLFCFADHNHGHIDGEFNNRLLRHCQQPYDCLLQKKEKGH